MSALPDFVVIGAMKCATSTLHDQLALQSQISMSDPKEPNFFSDGPNFARGMRWYHSLFESMPAEDLKGESSTHLTKYPVHPEAAERMHAAIPDAKLVYVMRDPVRRIVSQYIHEWSEHTITGDINQAIREHPRLISYSSYAMQIGKHTAFYEQSQILPVFFERLMSEPQREFERICAHIGYQGDPVWRDDEDAKNVSSARQRRSPMLNKVLDIQLVQTLRRSLLPEGLRERIKSRWTMKEKPELSEDSIAYVHEQLDPDMRSLGEMIGRPLSCANFAESVSDGESPEWVESGVTR